MIRTSDTINELAASMSSAQGAMPGASKDSANPFFKSKYADLASVMQAIRAPFAQNNLSFIQGTGKTEHGEIVVTTRIMHSSGQWVECDTVLSPVKDDPQGIGSAISYGKRYGLQSLAGVPSVDDDGNAAVENVKPRKKRSKPATDLSKARTWLEQAASSSMAELEEQWKSLDAETRVALGSEYTKGLKRRATDAERRDDMGDEIPMGESQ